MTTPLWTPPEERVAASRMRAFMRFVNERQGVGLQDYNALYRWSVDRIPDFWASVWDFVGVKSSTGYDQVVDDPGKMPGASWFSGARLNYAENLLRFRDDEVAIIFKSEDRPPVRITYCELARRVADLAGAMRDSGIGIGDRVAAVMPTLPETVVAMLAAASLGALWSSCAPDFGARGIIDRLSQIEPKMLFVADGHFFEGIAIDSLEATSVIAGRLPSVEKVIVTPYIDPDPDLTGIPNAALLYDFAPPGSRPEIFFEQLPATHPILIMFTSGTTGPPKCLVQGAAGILLQHLKEQVIHFDITREDTFTFITSCGWMSWNWLVGVLATGATLVFYDGSPYYPHPGALMELTQDLGITMLGVSARYFETIMERGLRPGADYDLSGVRTILSSGSALSPECFEYVYCEVKGDVWLIDMAGGTEVNGNFVLGNPLDPVYAGEIQCRGLGMKVEVFDDEGKPCVDAKGDLVCLASAPPMPEYLWDDPDFSRYSSSYFDRWPGVWRQGDLVRLTERGSVVMYGRSDTAIRRGDLCIGTAEIYPAVEHMAEIDNSLVIEQSHSRIVLFVQLAPGIVLDEGLEQRIRESVAERVSPLVVPEVILAVPDIPYTLNMKKVESAVTDVIEGRPVLNRDSLKNPEALDQFSELHEMLKD
jgi:acetoacetyl-CoA synthetase